ncbi:MAG: hypothetical protein NTW10_05940 [Bacteroidetes bacterium]|nr:hypothetical protein [Bacteroidota bacterium]
MKIRLKLTVLLTAILAIVVSCASNKGSKDSNLAPGVHKITAAEVIQGSNYTYVRATSDGDDYWIAIERAEVKEGETYYWQMGAEMKEFTSKELKRTFRSIFFVQDFTDKPILKSEATPQKPLTSMAGKQIAPEIPGIKVPKVVGGMSIAELYANENTLAGKTVKVSGQVVKFSKEIMKKNWVHIQDGTKEGDKYDLTISTQDSVKVGDVVIFEGVAAVKKDVGAGYFYEILIEDAKLKK